MQTITIHVDTPENTEFLQNLLSRFNFVSSVETRNSQTELPEWHKQKLSERLNAYAENPTNVLDFETTINEIENEL